jgi:hypothetical protein
VLFPGKPVKALGFGYRSKDPVLSRAGVGKGCTALSLLVVLARYSWRWSPTELMSS